MRFNIRDSKSHEFEFGLYIKRYPPCDLVETII